MSNVRCRHAAVSKELLLERKDTQQVRHQTPDRPDSPLAPSPYLGRHIPEDRYSLPLEEAAQIDVEPGRVRHDRNIRPLPVHGTGHTKQESIDTRRVQNDFEDAHDRQALGPYYRPHAGRTHPRTGATEEFRLRKTIAKTLDKLSGMSIR